MSTQATINLLHFPSGTSVSGGGRRDPNEVTGSTNAEKLDKIAEIYYRVKFAQITQNDLWTDYFGGGGSSPSGVGYGSITPRVQWDAGTGLSPANLLHGYWTLDDPAYPAYASAIPYLDAAYTGTMDMFIAPVTSWEFRDIASDERGIFLPEQVGYQPLWNRPMPAFLGIGIFYSGANPDGGVTDQGFRTAFSWYSNSPSGDTNPPDIPVPYVSQISGGLVYENMSVMIEWSGEVAVVKTNPSDSDYASGNRYFLGVRIRFNVVGSGDEASANYDISLTPTSARYVLRLSSGDLSCPLASVSAPLTGDFVHEATEWFPYQDVGGNVWNPATGLPA